MGPSDFRSEKCAMLRTKNFSYYLDYYTAEVRDRRAAHFQDETWPFRTWH